MLTFRGKNGRSLHCALSKNKLQPPDFKWVAQVSILRPGFLLGVGPGRNTHLLFLPIIFIFLGGPQAHDFSVEKHSQGGTAEPQVPPLRCAPVGMTRGG
jgi:hypothetical protein